MGRVVNNDLFFSSCIIVGIRFISYNLLVLINEQVVCLLVVYHKTKCVAIYLKYFRGLQETFLKFTLTQQLHIVFFLSSLISKIYIFNTNTANGHWPLGTLFIYFIFIHYQWKTEGKKDSNFQYLVSQSVSQKLCQFCLVIYFCCIE